MIIQKGYNDKPILIAFEETGLWLSQGLDSNLETYKFDILIYPSLNELIDLRDMINAQIRNLTGV